MKTRKQVIDAFVRLQKKYMNIRGLVTVNAYRGEDDYWSVAVTVVAFEGREIVWRESVEWTHYSNQREADDARNAEAVEDFIQRMEDRI